MQGGWGAGGRPPRHRRTGRTRFLMTTGWIRKARARLALAVALALAAPVAGRTVPAAAAQTTTEAAVASELANFVNRERAARGLPALQLEGYAAGVAQDWAERLRSPGPLTHRADLQ